MVRLAPAGFQSPSEGGRRLTAVGASLAIHAIAVGALVALGTRMVQPEIPLPAVRLVLVEPAPPPRLGVPLGHESFGQTTSAEAPKLEPQASEPAPEAEARPINPMRTQSAIVKPRPKAPRTKAEAPQLSQLATAAQPRDDGGDQAIPVALGSIDGSEAGAVNGLAGGRVGGLGAELVSASQAATPPTIARRVMPVYPERARVRGIEGQVMIEAVIATDGTVEPDIRVIQSIPELDAAAIEAFRRWRFTPARDAVGKPLRVILQAPVRFVLR